MSTANAMRYAYIKFNNVVSEVRALERSKTRRLDGGPEAYVANFIEIAGETPSLLISFHRNPPEHFHLNQSNIEAHSFHWASRLSIASLVSRFLVCLRAFRLILGFRPTHIICSERDFKLWMCFVASRIFRVPLICTRHSRFPTASDPLHSRFLSAIDRWITRRAATVLPHGPYLKRQLLDIGVEEGRIVEFNWGFQHLLTGITDSTNTIPDLTAEGRLSLIVYVGRIQILKGIFDLLQACRGLLLADDSIRLVYVGDGSDLQALKGQTADLGLEERVIFLGRVEHTALGGILRQGSVVVTPSKSELPEGRCMATMEALIMGVPVIAPDFGPFPYLVEDGVNGLLFEPDSVTDLERQIRQIVDHPKILGTLRAGAQRTGARLAQPEVGFREALRRALASGA